MSFRISAVEDRLRPDLFRRASTDLLTDFCFVSPSGIFLKPVRRLSERSLAVDGVGSGGVDSFIDLAALFSTCSLIGCDFAEGFKEADEVKAGDSFLMADDFGAVTEGSGGAIDDCADEEGALGTTGNCRERIQKI